MWVAAFIEHTIKYNNSTIKNVEDMRSSGRRWDLGEVFLPTGEKCGGCPSPRKNSLYENDVI